MASTPVTGVGGCVSYRPSWAPSSAAMWRPAAWNVAQLRTEITALSKVFSSLRVPLPAMPSTQPGQLDGDGFNMPAPLPPQLLRLQQLYGIVRQVKGRANPVLFDLNNSVYTNLAQSIAWATTVAQTIPQDLVDEVELKNEIDVTVPGAVAWMTAMLPVLRGLFPGKKITFSVSGGRDNTGLQAAVTALSGVAVFDSIQLHLYAATLDALDVSRIGQAVAIAAPYAPLIIGETGLPSYGNSEWSQFAWHTRVQREAAVQGVPARPWMGVDCPTQTSPYEASYGLFGVAADGTLTPRQALSVYAPAPTS